MDTKELSMEQISAFADGELSDAQAEVVLAALRTEQGLAAWNAYHLIGDAARSDETAVAMSPDFFSKFSARLEAEPTIIAPVHADQAEQRRAAKSSTVRRFAIPAVALTLAAAIVFMLQPQPAAVVATATPAPAAATGVPAETVAAAPAASTGPAVATLVQDGEVVRDPKIDKFLGKHDGFTPQQGSEQYSRSAAFKVDADK
ncbi:histidine kinase [Oxalobacteraceae bacterium CAVE-383]|nr:histidine kinase [Oxalobacteraceae bacterium CAVE-383]